MLTYFKINSEQALEWDEDLNDLTVFIVIIATVEHEFGFSTYIVSNRRQKGVASRFSVLRYSTIKVISQFDIKTETGITCLKEGMPVVVGLNALKAFIEAKRDRPFTYAGLKQVLEAIENQEEEGKEESLGCPSQVI